MSLFDLFKKKEKKEESGCSCSCSCGGAAKNEETSQSCSCSGNSDIKVLGSGCKNCHTLYENVQTAVKNMGLDIDTEYVTDMEKVMSYGAMSMPVLVINEQIASMGKVLKPAEVENILRKNGF